MNAAAESASPSAATRSIIDRLIAFNTVSRDSNLGLIEWARDYLHRHGATTRLTHDASGKKANLFATLGDSNKPGLILSGHTDVVPVEGQDWDTDPFVAVERDGKLYARGSADMKGFIGVALDGHERIRVPLLPFHRHHVGVTGENQARLLRIAERREQIGLLTAGVVREAGRCPVLMQVVAGPFDQTEVGIA